MGHEPSSVGGVEVSVLCDGWAPLPLSDEAPGHDVDWSAERAAHPWAFDPDDRARWAWHVHAFLLRVDEGPVLVDCGIGHLGRSPYDVAGRIDDELRTVGVSPTDVRHVIHTHLHSDHAGGACRPDGAPRFPNAIHHVHPADWAFFAGADDPDDFQGRSAMRRLAELGMLDLGPRDREIVPGVSVIHSPGHTPGHRSVLLTDDAVSMLLTGDLLHLPIQVAHPDWESSHDHEPGLGTASRSRLLARAREEGWEVAVSHFGQPFGRVLGLDRAQRWQSTRSSTDRASLAGRAPFTGPEKTLAGPEETGNG